MEGSDLYIFADKVPTFLLKIRDRFRTTFSCAEIWTSYLQKQALPLQQRAWSKHVNCIPENFYFAFHVSFRILSLFGDAFPTAYII